MSADPVGPGPSSGLVPAGLLAQFYEAGVLVPADVLVSGALGRLGGDADELVALATALAVRAPRRGHVLVDLTTITATATAERDEELDLSGLPWPPLQSWLEHLARSPLVAMGQAGPDDRPLRLVGTALYLDRYWRDECLVADDVAARCGVDPWELDEELLADGLRRLFPGEGTGLQCRAAAVAVRRPFSVIAGGPGTGKTTTVARLLALLDEQAAAAGRPPPLVALVAPTGKAAARMAESVHEAARMAHSVNEEAGGLEVDDAVRRRLLALGASTIHRLLGRHPASASRFRHDRHNRLPHDVVVVDETSMMSLPLMARLVEAVRRDGRLVLLGDPQQLASVEAGAVLGDIVGPAGAPGWRPTGAGTGIGECITVLQANHRFRGPLAELAVAVRAGDEAAVLEVLSSRPQSGATSPGTTSPGTTSPGTTSPGTASPGTASPGRTSPGTASPGRTSPDSGSAVDWLAADVATADEVTLAPLREAVLAAGQPLIEAARRGDGSGALAALGGLRLLCAHRDGPAGASTWNSRAEQWLFAGPAAVAGGGAGAWYVGRPVIVAENDYSLGLFNGDVGVVIAQPDGGLAVAFRRGMGVVTFSPSRVPGVATAFAMTAHRAQGSEFDVVVVLLPSASSRALTRELLYTAVTRARDRVVLVGTEESVRSAVRRRVARASGLTKRLWGGADEVSDYRA